MTEPYYTDDAVTLWHGDCREILSTHAHVPALFDLTLTDPPYNAFKEYDVYKDSLSPEDYAEWCRDWWRPVRDRSRRVAMFCGHGNIPMWYEIEKPAAIGCWYKPGNPGKSILGFEEWEPWLFWHGGNCGLLGGSSVIKQPLTIGRGLGHPCPKPVGLMAKLLVKTRATSVFDPFVGTGTTLIAAKELGIPAVGIELSERYCEIAAKRLAQGVLDFGEAS